MRRPRVLIGGPIGKPDSVTTRFWARFTIAQPVQRRDPGSVTAADLAKVGSCLSLFGTVGAFQPERAAKVIALDQSALSEKVIR